LMYHPGGEAELVRALKVLSTGASDPVEVMGAIIWY
jgi:hypothetical protein